MDGQVTMSRWPLPTSLTLWLSRSCCLPHKPQRQGVHYLQVHADAVFRAVRRLQGIQGETFETCCDWDRIDDVINAAKMEAKAQHEKHKLIGAHAQQPTSTLASSFLVL